MAELERAIEEVLRDVVLAHFPLDWKEDSITHALMVALRKQFNSTKLSPGVSIYGIRNRIDIEWEIYKFHGLAETRHGDIGLLVRYRLPKGDVLEGAGFIEAKIRGRDSRKFHQVRLSQVSRILSRSPQTRLLLYDYNAVAVLDQPAYSEPEWNCFHYMRSWGTHAHVTHGPVLPLQLAASVSEYDDTLYRFCHSFSYQFCYRYFHLHDLDFSDKAIQAVKGFPTKLGSPNFIMVLHIAPHGQELPERFRPNDNIYGSVVDD